MSESKLIFLDDDSNIGCNVSVGRLFSFTREDKIVAVVTMGVGPRWLLSFWRRWNRGCNKRREGGGQRGRRGRRRRGQRREGGEPRGAGG